MDEDRTPLTGALLAERYGVRFDGEAWILMVPLLEPLEETAFAAALDPEIIAASSGRPTGMVLLPIDTPHGIVLRFSILFFDELEAPWEMRLPVNPAPEGAGEMLGQLAEQETVQILFFHPHTGDPLDRRILPFSLEHRLLLSAIVDHAKQRPSSLEKWTAAVESARHLL